MIEETIEEVKEFKTIIDELDKTAKLIPQITPDDVIGLENKLCPRTYISSNDSRLNYTFCKEEDIKEKNNLPEIINLDDVEDGILVISQKKRKTCLSK